MDVLIAVANTALWPELTEALNLATTNVCIQELKRHVQQTSEYPLTGLVNSGFRMGVRTRLFPFEDDSNTSLTVVSSVPRPQIDAEVETDLKDMAAVLERGDDRLFDAPAAPNTDDDTEDRSRIVLTEVLPLHRFGVRR